MQKTISKRYFAGFKLSLALMLGLLVVPAYVVAPILFKTLVGQDAGLLAGQIFHVCNLAVLILAVAALVFAYRMQVATSTWYMLWLVVLLVAANAFGVATVMAMIKAEAGDISALAQADSMRWMFAFWHGLGSILHLMSSVLLVILVMQGQCPRPKEQHQAAV
ncbi:MAG: DUF4149 domain-containing protein [Mariprofundaceae bacterium]|nr:DUF4149 domain-containing protein [Mariprofundaceae bacterium]